MPSTGPGKKVCSGGCRIIDGLLSSVSFTFIHLLNPRSWPEPSHLYIHTYIKAWYLRYKDFGGKNGVTKGSLTHRRLYRKECDVKICSGLYCAILDKYFIFMLYWNNIWIKLPWAEIKYKCRNSCDTIRLAQAKEKIDSPCFYCSLSLNVIYFFTRD